MYGKEKEQDFHIFLPQDGDKVDVFIYFKNI